MKSLVKLAIYVLLFIPFTLFANESKLSSFIGSWCANPCYFGASNWRKNKPCVFDVTETEIVWLSHDTSLAPFRRKYEIQSKDETEEIFLLFGGNEKYWFEGKENSQYKHRFIFSRNHKQKNHLVHFRHQYWHKRTDQWQGSSSMYIRNNEILGCG